MSDILTAEEIREIRQTYGLSQKSFALLLGIGPASMVRYEQGSQPSKANANLIRAARNPDFMRECFERDGGLLPPVQQKKASKTIYAFVSLDDEQEDTAMGTNKMNEMYELTLRQEILNEKAANIMGEIISQQIGGGFPGSANDVFGNLLDQVAEVKYAIIDFRSAEELDKVDGFLDCAQRMAKRQLREVA